MGLTELASTVLVTGSLLSALLATWRIIKGPTNADRVVALDIFLAAAIATAVAASIYSERTVFLDVAIGLAMVGFVGTIGWARMIARAPAAGVEEGEA